MLALAYQLRQNSKFPYFPRVVVVGGGWVVKLKLKLNSAQLKLELGLSLAIISNGISKISKIIEKRCHPMF
jgi:hypothetical protein